MHFAKKLDLIPIGTMAHKYRRTFQATGLQLSGFQKASLKAWVQEYRGDLGVALTGVLGMDAFLADFNPNFAKLFDSLQYYSGDFFVWREKVFAHYTKLKLDARAKRLMFSDGLNVPTALNLYRRFADRVQTGFGIGINLNNDTGLKPLNIVMKLVNCNG